MLARWAGGTEGNLFPLCRSTYFKATFEESMNKATHLDRLGVQEPLKNRKHQYKIPGRFLERNVLRIHFGDCERTFFYYIDGEDYTLLDWYLRVQFVV
jgi:hypothetical protein